VPKRQRSRRRVRGTSTCSDMQIWEEVCSCLKYEAIEAGGGPRGEAHIEICQVFEAEASVLRSGPKLREQEERLRANGPRGKSCSTCRFLRVSFDYAVKPGSDANLRKPGSQPKTKKEKHGHEDFGESTRKEPQ
jgi:hypothetical protein